MPLSHDELALINRYWHAANYLSVGQIYKEEGTTTTPFDMVVLNNMDRYTLAIDAIHRMGKFKKAADAAVREFQSKLAEHTRYIHENGEDMPEVRNWNWQA